MSEVRLVEGYYLQNFLAVIDEVDARDGDLLEPGERALLARFRSLSLGAQRLYVRLLTRKGPWFRLDSLNYPEIGDPLPLVEELLQAGFCENRPELKDLLPLLLRADALRALADLGLTPPKGARRQELLDGLVDCADLGRLSSQLHPLKPCWDELWTRIFLMYFGNFEQDLATFVVADTGIIRYESYRVDPNLRLFEARADVDYLLSLRSLREQLQATPSEADLDTLTQTALSMETHPGIRQQRRYQRLLNELGQAWERVRNLDKAMACFSRSERPPARERRVRILAAQGQAKTACRLAMDLLETPQDVAEVRFARGFLERRRRGDVMVEAWLRNHPQPEAPPELRLQLPRHPEGVEQAALRAARLAGWEGFFAENSLWRALFGLLFWGELFADVPGAFRHRFQSAPLDLGSAGFYQRRRERIDLRLAALSAGENLRDQLLQVAGEKWGVANAFLNWRHLERWQLAEALGRIEPPVLAGVMRLMLRNPLAFASGFPDLFLFHPASGAWKLWEVKGPGDILRPEQEWWLRQFKQWGVEALVVKVVYAE